MNKSKKEPKPPIRGGSKISAKKVQTSWLFEKILLRPPRDVLWLIQEMFCKRPNLLYLYPFRSELTRKNSMKEYRGVFKHLDDSVNFCVLFRFLVNTCAQEPTYTNIDLYCENIEVITLNQWFSTVCNQNQSCFLTAHEKSITVLMTHQARLTITTDEILSNA